METHGLLEALAEPHRRAIFERLGRGPCSVVDLAATVPISRPAVSQHLRVLKDAGLVTVEPQGTRRIYSVDPEGLAAIREYFDQFWNETLAAYGDATTSTSEEKQ